MNKWILISKFTSSPSPYLYPVSAPVHKYLHLCCLFTGWRSNDKPFSPSLWYYTIHWFLQLHTDSNGVWANKHTTPLTHATYLFFHVLSTECHHHFRRETCGWSCVQTPQLILARQSAMQWTAPSPQSHYQGSASQPPHSRGTDRIRKNIAEYMSLYLL